MEITDELSYMTERQQKFCKDVYERYASGIPIKQIMLEVDSWHYPKIQIAYEIYKRYITRNDIALGHKNEPYYLTEDDCEIEEYKFENLSLNEKQFYEEYRRRHGLL